ncbi:ABC transporter ATP-binding protein [Pseudoclavibacter sp. VKM Ac-2867]|uniref:ABC transporter ATP-binding protein n=1 Tax=Pseudoclavibacter sp. VKM Ac-2867 TaxID=2783829 RepID=UPI00188C8D6F|nr:ABC transporter ATP-binding protein [Pseudoclavibacter sp. VKM Ac-2867]MBF4457872.1 ABC transporter ATP-binding protein [Pseudoclavibacter sp. VKM Ac-2867]
MTTTPALELEHVSRIHPGGVVALDDVSLQIDPGELTAIVGRSGAGKSTLLNVLGTLDRPTSGAVRIGGTDTRNLTDRALSTLRGSTIGFVFQGFHLSDGVTAEQNVMMALLYSGVPRRARRDLARAALERVGLEHRIGHAAQELSGGERQRVAIARAIVTDPLVVLADEPTGALDTANGERVLGLLERLHDEGTTVVVITHDVELATRLPRRVELRDGRIVADTNIDTTTTEAGTEAVEHA